MDLDSKVTISAPEINLAETLSLPMAAVTL